MGRIEKERDDCRRRPLLGRPQAGPWLVAILATAAAWATVAPEAGGPGVTCDEWQNIQVGKRLVTAFRHEGFRFFTPARIRANFPWTAEGPPFHPPLGNWILGWTHYVLDPAPDDPRAVSVTAGRLAVALILGMTVLVVGLGTFGLAGPVAGTAAAAAVALVPRYFGHGRLAGLDPITAFFFVTALFLAIWAERAGKGWWGFALAGVVAGLTLLTRLHGLLLVPPVAVWLVWRLRRRALLPLVVWGGSALATFVAGWPWLWLDPWGHFWLYLTTGTGRPPLHVYYAGRVWADWQVPWHYPWVMLAATLPLGLLLLGLAGLWASRPGRPDGARAGAGFGLLVGALVFVLLVFTWPPTPVYDGVRLFLMAFPLWAVAVGVGAAWCVEHPGWGRVGARWRVAGMAFFLALQGVGLVVYRDGPLSHYSLLVGGLPGAARLGFEVNYWGDAVREEALAEVARVAGGEVVLFGPHLAPYQVMGVWVGSAALVDGQVELVGWDAGRGLPAGCRYGLFYHRRADLGVIPAAWTGGRVIFERRNQGVWLVRFVELGDAGAGPGRSGPLDGDGREPVQ